MKRGFIPPVEAHFLELVLAQGSPVAKKHGLQRFCALYRRGFRLRNPMPIKGGVFQALTDPDQKVRRWAFNALAQFGDAADAPLMKGALLACRLERDVFEAGLTAIAHILSKEEVITYLASIQVGIDAGAILALSQQSDQFAFELSGLTLDVNSATNEELRSATLLVGLRRAPDRIFSSHHPASDVLGELNTHPDLIVAQYSFWATVEHPDLGLAHARVSPANFSDLPPNVQSWAYRVLTKNGNISIKHYDSIIRASESPFPEVRQGLAIGIRDIFYDSLDTTVVDWYVDESDVVIRDRLLEHMAAHAGKASFYKDEVLDNYRNSAPNSELRARLEAANNDPAIHIEMRKMALRSGEPNLWDAIRGDGMGTTQNFFGTVTAGGISVSGSGNTGQVHITSPQQAAAAATSILCELLQRLEASNAPQGAAEGANIAKEALRQPSKTKFSQLVGWLKGAKEAGDATSGLAKLAAEFYEKAEPVLEHLADAV